MSSERSPEIQFYQCGPKLPKECDEDYKFLLRCYDTEFPGKEFENFDDAGQFKLAHMEPVMGVSTNVLEKQGWTHGYFSASLQTYSADEAYQFAIADVDSSRPIEENELKSYINKYDQDIVQSLGMLTTLIVARPAFNINMAFNIDLEQAGIEQLQSPFMFALANSNQDKRLYVGKEPGITDEDMWEREAGNYSHGLIDNDVLKQAAWNTITDMLDVLHEQAVTAASKL